MNRDKKLNAYLTPLSDAQRDQIEVLKRTFPIAADWDRVKLAFEFLRKEFGFVTRMNYYCCGGCAGYAIASKATNHKLPMVTFHRQASARAFKGGSELRGDLHLGFGVIVNNELNTVDPVPEKRAADAIVGQRVREVMEAFGFTVVWDGTVEQCIVLKSDYEERRRLEHERRKAESNAWTVVRALNYYIDMLQKAKLARDDVITLCQLDADHDFELDQYLQDAVLRRGEAEEYLKAFTSATVR